MLNGTLDQGYEVTEQHEGRAWDIRRLHMSPHDAARSAEQQSEWRVAQHLWTQLNQLDQARACKHVADVTQLGDLWRKHGDQRESFRDFVHRYLPAQGYRWDEHSGIVVHVADRCLMCGEDRNASNQPRTGHRC